MCHKLIQTYACGHSKPICTTPCAHALKSATLPPPTNAIARSNSTVSTFTAEASSPAPVSRATPLSQLRVINVDMPSTHRDTAQVPTLHFDPPSTPSSAASASPVSPVSSVPSGFTTPVCFRSHACTHSPSSSPLESHSPAAGLSHAPTSSAVVAATVAALEPAPKLCAYYFPRHLTASKYPCFECYGQPRWGALRARWMESYSLGHPLGRLGDVEVLSGVKGVLEGDGRGY